MASRNSNVFLSSFMQGFSFIDDINSRKRREDMLEKRLDDATAHREFQRQRLTQIDAERGADRATRITQEGRMKEVNRILADPNATDEELEPFTDIPEVAAFVRGRRQDVTDRQDLEALSRGEGLRGAVGALPAAAPQPPVSEEAAGGLTEAVQDVELPGAQFTTPEKLTDRELNELADTDPAAAAQLRDEQSAEKAERDRLRKQTQAAGSFNASDIPLTEGQKLAEKRRSQQDLLNQEWDVFLDINEPSGDQLRNLDPNLLTAKYFDDRGSIQDPQMQDALDKRMAPHIQETITAQQALLSEATPQSPEFRNAGRKLSEAYALANEINIEYEPLRQNGVDARGLPTNGGNVALTDAVVNSVGQGPGSSLPPNPNTTRADLTMISRGTTGRVSERFAQAAFRQYKNGRINFAQYDSLMRTGRLPQAAPVISQTDPKQDTWRTDPNTGHQQLIIPARHVPTSKELEEKSRNIINKDGLAHIRTLERAYNTGDDKTRGTKLTNAFITALASNEQRATQGGYDLSTVNDVGLLYQRWLDLHVYRDAYNDEWIADGKAFPDFTTEYGTMPEVLFNTTIDEAAKTGELEVPGTTTLGMFGESPRITPLKGRDPRVYDAIRNNPDFPELHGKSNEEIEAAIQSQQGR